MIPQVVPVDMTVITIVVAAFGVLISVIQILGLNTLRDMQSRMMRLENWVFGLAKKDGN
jgi:hypothetical protein